MKKSNKKIGIVIIGLLAVIFAITIIFAVTRENTNPFHPNRTGRGQIMYDAVMSLNETYNYPPTPEEVMAMQENILMLLYGEFIINEELFPEVLQQQRLLFGDELLALNPFEEQYYNFMYNHVMLQEQGVRLISMDVSPIVQNPHMPNIAMARVTQNFENLGRVNWVYYLERSTTDNKWRITSWTIADEHFNPVVIY